MFVEERLDPPLEGSRHRRIAPPDGVAELVDGDELSVRDGARGVGRVPVADVAVVATADDERGDGDLPQREPIAPGEAASENGRLRHGARGQGPSDRTDRPLA